MKTLFQRLFEPTPAFFQLVQKISASIAAIIALVMALPSIGVVLPETVHKLFNSYTLAMPFITIAISQLASIWRKADGTIDREKKFEFLAEKAKE